MRGGRLRHRVTFEEPVSHQNEFGENVPDWDEVCTVWASIQPLSGKQLSLAQASTRTATATHQLRIRYRDDLAETMRIRYDGPDPDEYNSNARYFEINALLDTDEHRDELVITATEVRQ